MLCVAASIWFLLTMGTYLDLDNKAQSACPGTGVSERDWHHPSFSHPLRMNVRVTCLDESVRRFG
jgi:hypothetical protein